MTRENKPKMRLGRGIFGLFFAVIAVLGLLGNLVTPTGVAYADPVEGETSSENAGEGDGGGNSGNNSGNSGNNSGNSASKTSTVDGCQASLGPIAWLGCSFTEKIAEAVDWLYEKIQEFLVVNPIEAEDGSPFYEIWKYCRGLTNIVFIIFLLVVIYSQITGVGISNYGIKKALPKLIIVAVLVNLSFLICQLAVDLSNVIGNGLRGLFISVEDAAIAGMQTGSGSAMTSAEAKIANADMFHAIAGGSVLAVGGAAIAFETGAIWMLIPTVLGAIVAVATGLITIALRQAVVALLVMISPLAVVAYMLPNTEELFKRWRKLLTQMLVFYPMFSLLFGAASLAGFAIIAGATDGFGLILGTAVQIFPLFFSWKLMQMSGTFLGTINTKMRELTASPMAKNRGWADSHRLNSKQKRLASGMPVTPSLRLMQFVSNRKVAREAETGEKEELVKNRGLAYRAGRNYNRKGVPTRRAEDAYRDQARTMEYQRIVARDKNNLEKGLSDLAATKAHASAEQKARMVGLDNRMIAAADYLKVEQARGEKITYDNAMSYHKRMEQAMNAHFDAENADLRDDKGNLIYRQHDMEASDRAKAATRYSTMSKIMEGNAADVQFAAADAAHAYDTQKKILETKYQKYFELTPPTKDVEYRLGEITKLPNASEYIDTIVPGLRILNQRGDTDLMRKQLENVLNSTDGVQLGSHASQSLASFLMFEVKDNDPFMRRYGKYINLETAKVYNKNERQNARLSLEEYVTGEYEDWSRDDPTQKVVGKSKRSIVPLVLGTSLDNVERTAYSNLDDILKRAYTDGSGNLDVSKYLEKRGEIEEAITPAFISASLKYLAGSEQLQNAVSFKTGIDSNGKKRWEDGGDLAGSAELAEAYFRKNTLKYLKDQTGGQLMNLRSDYHDAVWDHLFEAYFEEDPDDLFGDVTSREEFEQMRAEIQTRYGDLPPEEAETRRKRDLKELKDEFAEAELRKTLGDTGVLDRIPKLSRTSASSATKGWMNKGLSVEDEDRLQAEIEFYKAKRRAKHENSVRRKNDDDMQNDRSPSGVYDETDVTDNLARLARFQNDHRGVNDVNAIYAELIDLVRERLGSNTFIEEEFSRRYGKHGEPGVVQDDVQESELYEFMEEYLGDLRWY